MADVNLYRKALEDAQRELVGRTDAIIYNAGGR